MIMMIMLSGITSNISAERIVQCTVMNEKWNFMLAIRVAVYHVDDYAGAVVEVQEEDIGRCGSTREEESGEELVS